MAKGLAGAVWLGSWDGDYPGLWSRLNRSIRALGRGRHEGCSQAMRWARRGTEGDAVTEAERLESLCWKEPQPRNTGGFGKLESKEVGSPLRASSWILKFQISPSFLLESYRPGRQLALAQGTAQSTFVEWKTYKIKSTLQSTYKFKSICAQG